MNKIVVSGIALIVMLALSGCDRNEGTAREDADSSFASSDAEVIKRISNLENEIDLVLTSESVYMQLSEEKLGEIKEEFADERAEEEDNALANTIKNVVLDNIEKLLQERIEYPIEEVNAMYWDDGEIIIEVEDENFISFNDISVDHGDALESFAEDDALEFIAAFESLKGGS